MVNLTKDYTVTTETVKENTMENFINELFDIVTDRFNGIVTMHEVIKNNEALTGFTFRRTEDQKIAPTLYPQSCFNRYENGDTTLDEIADDMIEMVERELETNLDVDLSDFTEWDKVKANVVPVVISKETNAEMLKNLAYTDTKTDLAIVYNIVLKDFDDGGHASVKITKEIKEKLNVTMTEIKKYAFANAKESMECESMGKVLAELMGDDMLEMDNGMWVLSNKSKVNGAGVMFVPSVMREVAKTVKLKEFFILPSSIHEVLVVTLPDAKADELKAMVMDVNATQVAPRDRLSDSVYYYDGKNVTKVA